MPAEVQAVVDVVVEVSVPPVVLARYEQDAVVPLLVPAQVQVLVGGTELVAAKLPGVPWRQVLAAPPQMPFTGIAALLEQVEVVPSEAVAVPTYASARLLYMIQWPEATGETTPTPLLIEKEAASVVVQSKRMNSTGAAPVEYEERTAVRVQVGAASACCGAMPKRASARKQVLRANERLINDIGMVNS